MSFTVGETVVYPNHGAAVIEDIEMRTIKGKELQYLVLRVVAQQDLVVRVRRATSIWSVFVTLSTRPVLTVFSTCSAPPTLKNRPTGRVVSRQTWRSFTQVT